MKTVVGCSVAALLLLSAPLRAADAIPWQPWSDAAFAQAERENKFVLLDLHAVWCHWCHVMDEQTYRDPKVVALIRSRYVPIGVDQESRPDLANRYEDYGWPATIVFAADGSEIVKRRGYLPPAQMASILQAIIDDPSPGPSVTAEADMHPPAEGVLPADLRAELEANLRAGFDNQRGCWGGDQNYLDWDNAEFCLRAAPPFARRALTAQHALLDPVWGGVFQYSTDRDWKHPHFEKIMPMQAGNLRVYSLAYAQSHDPHDLEMARAIERFAGNFLTSPEGAFYTSQDADVVQGQHSAAYFRLNDKARRKQGIPRVDTHVYARENGWMISALAALYEAAGDPATLARATRAADWIIGHRALPEGGFRHDERDATGPFLGDTLAMGQASLDLYAATADPARLARAEAAAAFIAAHFQSKSAGCLTAEPGGLPPPRPQFDENVAVARFANLLAHYTGNVADRALATTAMRYVATPELLRPKKGYVGGALLANDENAHEPVHLTVVGGKDDAAARALFTAALACPTAYKQIEWWDRRENPNAPGGIDYPTLDKAAAYLCANGNCSRPMSDPASLTAKLVQKGTVPNGPK